MTVKRRGARRRVDRARVGPTLEAPQECDELRSGRHLVRGEATFAGAGGDPGRPQPVDGLVEPRARRDVVERTAGDRGAIVEPVQERGELGAGRGLVGAEPVGGEPRRDPGVRRPADRTFVERPRDDVVEGVVGVGRGRAVAPGHVAMDHRDHLGAGGGAGRVELELGHAGRDRGGLRPVDRRLVPGAGCDVAEGSGRRRRTVGGGAQHRGHHRGGDGADDRPAAPAHDEPMRSPMARAVSITAAAMSARARSPGKR